MPQVEVNIRTDGEINAQTDVSSGGKLSMLKIHRQMSQIEINTPTDGRSIQRQVTQVEVNIQTDGDINAQTDVSSGGKYSDRWGHKCTDKCSSGGKYSDRWGDKCTDKFPT